MIREFRVQNHKLLIICAKISVKMIQCFIFVLIIGISQLNGLPYAKTADYYNDDYNYSADDEYINGDGHYGGNGLLGENEKVVYAIPEITSDSTDEIINEGDTIKLPCMVDKLVGFVLMWKKGDDLIALSNSLYPKYKSDNRIQLKQEKNGNTLIISLAEPADAGDYSCSVSANNKDVRLEHKVRIRVAPVLRAWPAERLVVREGESASMACKIVKGSPSPTIKWTRKDRKMPDGEESLQGQQITFPKATRHHSGYYTCTGDNDFKPLPETASKTIVLDVQHSPEIEQEQTFIHTRETDETEVTCIVHASPRAKVEWFKDDQLLTKDEAFFKQHKNRHTIVLPGIKESTFGRYTCRATNKYGSDARTTEVSGNAGPPSFKSEQDGSEKTRYALEWVGESITPITAFKVEYRRDDGDRSYLRPRMEKSYRSFTTVTELSNSIEDIDDSDQIVDDIDGKVWTVIEEDIIPISNGDHHYTGRHTLTELSPQTRYLVRVSSRNDYGFSQPLPSSYFEFGTLGAAPLQQPSTGGAASSFRHEGVYKLVTVTASFILMSLFSPAVQLAFNWKFSFCHV